MLRRRPAVLLMLPLAGVLALAGCSGGSSPAATPTALSSTTPGATTSPTNTNTNTTPAVHPSAPATEFNPPGDIPDNQVFVDYKLPGSPVTIKVPEAWPRSVKGGVATFTDHYNSIALQVLPAAQRPTVGSARSVELPALRSQVAKFGLQGVSETQRSAGAVVLAKYLLDSAPNPVTGKVVRDIAERYEFWKAGQEAVLTLTGPQGADNVDPWKLVSDSLHWG